VVAPRHRQSGRPVLCLLEHDRSRRPLFNWSHHFGLHDLQQGASATATVGRARRLFERVSPSSPSHSLTLTPHRTKHVDVRAQIDFQMALVVGCTVNTPETSKPTAGNESLDTLSSFQLMADHVEAPEPVRKVAIWEIPVSGRLQRYREEEVMDPPCPGSARKESD